MDECDRGFRKERKSIRPVADDNSDSRNTTLVLDVRTSIRCFPGELLRRDRHIGAGGHYNDKPATPTPQRPFLDRPDGLDRWVTFLITLRSYCHALSTN